jgi:hypothetical protein
MLSKLRTFTKAEIFTLLLTAVITIAAYIMLNGVYRPDNIDDPWSLSFADNFVNHGVAVDKVFGQDAAGDSGVQLFGITHAVAYGKILNMIGWTRFNAHLISIFFVLLSAPVWFAVLRRTALGSAGAAAFSLAYLFVEPVFAAANQARPDAMILFFAALALYSAVKEMWFAAGLICAVSIELHPVGAITICYPAALMISSAVLGDKQWSSIFRQSGFLFLGGLTGLLYYLALHYRALPLLVSGLQAAGGSSQHFDNALVQYFFHTKYMRHLPELAVMLMASAVYIIRKRWKSDPFAGILFMLTVLFIFIIRRPNFMYAVFVYPAFLLLVMSALKGIIKPYYICIALLLYLVPQYMFVWIKNRNVDMPGYLAKLEAAVPQDSVPVVGPPCSWYVFRDRGFFVSSYEGGLSRLNLKEFYYIDEEQPQYPVDAEIKSRYKMIPAASFEHNSSVTKVFLARPGSKAGAH